MSGIVLHDLGDPAAGARWREALPDGWAAPDLPGHGAAPAPRHGGYDPMGPLTLARWHLAGVDPSGTVVGVRQNAHAALVLAAGGGCGAVAVVDGLWGPWATPEGHIADMYRGLRRLIEDPAAVGPPPADGLDPRTAHGYGLGVSSAFCRELWGAVELPVLVIETPGSTTPPGERAERTSWFGGRVTLVELEDDAPSAVMAAVAAWPLD